MSVIRIVATPDDPYARDCFDLYPSYCKNPGFEIEYMYTILNNILGYETELVKVDTYEDVEKALERGQADIAGTSLMLDEYYYSRFYYTSAYVWDGVAFIAKLNVGDNFNSFSLFDSFTIDLWLTMCITTIITMAINWYSHKLYFLKTESYLTWFCHKLRSRGLSALWFIFVTILLNFYSNLMIVELLNPLQVAAPAFDSVPALGKKLLSKECRLALLEKYRDNIEFHKTFINPYEGMKDSWADDYRNAFKINPPIYTGSREETVSYVQNSTCVIGVDFATMESYYQTRFCGIRFVSFPKELQLFAYVFYFKKYELARNLSIVMATDPVLEWPNELARKYYVADISPVCDQLLTNSVSDSLPLEKFYGVFIVFFGALFLCALVCFSPWLLIWIAKSTMPYSRIIKLERVHL